MTEAADLLIAIEPRARSKKERRVAVWRKLRGALTLNRISEIDRRSSRIVLTADEMKSLRQAARQSDEASELRRVCDRIATLEAAFAELCAFRAQLGRADAEAAGGYVGQLRRKSDRAQPATYDCVSPDRALAMGQAGD